MEYTQQKLALADGYVLDFDHYEDAWEAVLPETGICLKANNLHSGRGCVFNFPEPVASMIREVLTGIKAKPPVKVVKPKPKPPPEPEPQPEPEPLPTPPEPELATEPQA